MQHVFYLLLRRLRTPIITVICVYAISILGFVLIPGRDNLGNAWHMDFFHAFYFVSFMGTTIGFGEIPYPFVAPQRFWAIITIYATVTSWLYAIGTIIAMFQEPNFLRLIKRNGFRRRVKRLNEPYYLVCGYGATGYQLVHRLDKHDIKCVVIENKQQLIDELEADELALSTPFLCADAADPEVLQLAGIQNPMCAGVLALTDDDHANLSIAIDSKLVNPKRPVISRTQSKATSDNLASFDTDHIIDPFHAFARDLMTALQEPYKHLIYDIIINPNHRVMSSPYQHTEGRWVICGYGRFGTALEDELLDKGIEITFIDPEPEKTRAPAGTIKGIGTEADTLLEAGIDSAVGIVAGTPDDANNLSIIITARDLNPNLITVARQNLRVNKPVFRAAQVNMIMEPGRIIANEVYMRIRTPLLQEFFEQLAQQTEEKAKELFLTLSALCDTQDLTVWTIEVGPKNARALFDALNSKNPVRLGDLTRRPGNRDIIMKVIPLMVKRGDQVQFLPADEVALELGDQVLYCGRSNAQLAMGWILNNHNILRYIRTGRRGQDGLIWRRLYKNRRNRMAARTDSVVEHDIE